MVRLTARAGALLQRIPTERPLRLVLDSDGPLIGTSAPEPNDTVLFYEGGAVLRLSAQAEQALAGATIATGGTAAPDELVILGPNEPVDEQTQ